jgi:hypothetical protein
MRADHIGEACRSLCKASLAIDWRWLVAAV